MAQIPPRSKPILRTESSDCESLEDNHSTFAKIRRTLRSRYNAPQQKQLHFGKNVTPSTAMLTVTEAKQRLLTILKTKSVFHGDFVLASGQRSNYYVDCRLTTLDPEGATLVGQVLYSLIEDHIAQTGARVDAVGGLTMGADPISLAIGMRSFQRRPDAPFKCFVVRKEPKGHGQGKQIEGNFASGDSVVVIDDVVTKGDSTLKAVEAVEKEGGKVAFVV